MQRLGYTRISPRRRPELAAIALGWFAFAKSFKVRSDFAFRSRFLAQLPACFGFAVECPGDGGWTARFAESQRFHFELAAFIFHTQHVADFDIARGLDELSVCMNAT